MSLLPSSVISAPSLAAFETNLYQMRLCQETFYSALHILPGTSVLCPWSLFIA